MPEPDEDNSRRHLRRKTKRASSPHTLFFNIKVGFFISKLETSKISGAKEGDRQKSENWSEEM